MNHPIVRPPVADLVFRLYDRPLHPELFATLAQRRVRREGYSMTVRVTPTGHVLEWERDGVHVTEAIATLDQGLPSVGQKLAHKFEGERRGVCDVSRGVRYSMNLQVETLSPEVFLHVHEELVADGAKRGLLFHFRPHTRLGLAPVGFVTVEAFPFGLQIGAFHTFPEEFVVVKTQSLIEKTT